MDTLSARVIAAVSEAKTIATEAHQKADRVEESVGLVEEGIDRVSGAAKLTAPMPAEVEPSEAAATVQLNSTQQTVLRAVSRLTLRTATGIAKDSGVPRSQIGEILDELINKGLVEVTTSPNTGGVRHRITQLGAQVLNRD